MELHCSSPPRRGLYVVIVRIGADGIISYTSPRLSPSPPSTRAGRAFLVFTQVITLCRPVSPPCVAKENSSVVQRCACARLQCRIRGRKLLRWFFLIDFSRSISFRPGRLLHSTDCPRHDLADFNRRPTTRIPAFVCVNNINNYRRQLV